MTQDLSYIDGLTVEQNFEEEADYVVVGTGAAGATAAKTLAEAGFEVVMIEEGTWFHKEDFTTPLLDTMTRLFRDAGGQVAQGRAFFPIIQGRCVGGSTVINSAIVWRLPEEVHDDWCKNYGLGDTLPLDALEKNFDQIEREISIQPTQSSSQGASNLLMHHVLKKMQLSGAPTRRYEKDCRGSGRCLQGCPHDAKQSMALSYVPQAIRHGARLYTCCRVEQLEREGTRVVGVSGTFRQPENGRGRFRLTVRARHGVILGASTIQSPQILQRAGVPGKHLGRHFQAHPGVVVLGAFDGVDRAWRGATQGYDADHYRITEGFKLEVLNLPPEMIAARLPGVGSEFKEVMQDFDRCAVWVVQNRARAQGRVRAVGSGAFVSYDLLDEDAHRMRRGVEVLSEMLFEAGARTVYPGIYNGPTRMSSPDDIAQLAQTPPDSRVYSMALTHLFGTTRMGTDPARSVVGPDFQVHNAPGAYVVDSSVFPTNLGVNPQHSIMAMSMWATQQMIDRAA